jgi:iron complex transport system permease protein
LDYGFFGWSNLGHGYSLIRLSSDMECLALGEKEACLMGVDVDRVKKVVFFTAALAAGTTVAMTGIIGFVGLVVPHILRSSVRLNMRSFMIACFFVGGSFLVGADVLSRTLIAPTEIPIGILTSLVGTPYFVYLLRQRRGRTYA